MDKHKLLKKVLIIILIVAAAIFFADWAMGKYKFWQETKKIDKLAQALRDIEKKDYEMAMADTYGGKTPEETLTLFIKAVEAGDYALASKYLVSGEREKEKDNLTALQQKNNLDKFLEIIKQAEPDGEIIDDTFRMRSKTELGPYYFVRFKKYPNDIWKIIEI